MNKSLFKKSNSSLNSGFTINSDWHYRALEAVTMAPAYTHDALEAEVGKSLRLGVPGPPEEHSESSLY